MGVTPTTLRLLGRPGCHLCDEMEETLQGVLARQGLLYEKVDVDEDPALRRAYGEVIPVLLDGERELARIRISRRRLEALLVRRAESD